MYFSAYNIIHSTVCNYLAGGPQLNDRSRDLQCHHQVTIMPLDEQAAASTAESARIDVTWRISSSRRRLFNCTKAVYVETLLARDVPLV